MKTWQEMVALGDVAVAVSGRENKARVEAMRYWREAFDLRQLASGAY